MAELNIWVYREGVIYADDISGFSIEALDGEIGKVDSADNETDSSYLIVSTGPWILGKTVMLPAGVIEGIDYDNKSVFVARTKDQIKDAPEYDAERYASPEYHRELGDYYGAGLGGPRTV